MSGRTRSSGLARTVGAAYRRGSVHWPDCMCARSDGVTSASARTPCAVRSRDQYQDQYIDREMPLATRHVLNLAL